MRAASPGSEFRESAMRLGLVRKYRGQLLATARGRELSEDPVALWWHLARSIPPRAADAPRRLTPIVA